MLQSASSSVYQSISLGKHQPDMNIQNSECLEAFQFNDYCALSISEKQNMIFGNVIFVFPIKLLHIGSSKHVLFFYIMAPFWHCRQTTTPLQAKFGSHNKIMQ